MNWKEIRTWFQNDFNLGMFGFGISTVGIWFWVGQLFQASNAFQGALDMFLIFISLAMSRALFRDLKDDYGTKKFEGKE